MPRGSGAGAVRVVAGRLRGLRLEVIPGLEVRPTSDRVKEALFSMLTPRLPGARVLDCFSGSGALGLEALSRGAHSVVFVEVKARPLELLQRNIERAREAWRAGAPPGREATEFPEVRVLREDALRPGGWLPALGPFDLVLSDPPYREGLGRRFLEVLEPGPALGPGGLLVLEHERGVEPLGDFWSLVDRRRYGETVLSLFSHPPDPRSEPHVEGE